MATVLQLKKAKKTIVTDMTQDLDYMSDLQVCHNTSTGVMWAAVKGARGVKKFCISNDKTAVLCLILYYGSLLWNLIILSFSANVK